MISRKWITVCFVGICLWGGLSEISVRGETETMIQESRSNILPDITQTPEEWKERIWYGDDTQFRVESSGRDGGHCFSIASAAGADAAWTVTVPVEKAEWYRLSGWIKTENITGATGALLNIQNMQSVRTEAVSGSRDWTFVSTVFKAEVAALEINCLLGGWGNSTGRAWYSDVRLLPYGQTFPNKVDLEIHGDQLGKAISPQLFGHNLEHTRRAVWTGISAEKVANRKFAALDSGMPKRWWTLPDGGVSVDHDVPFAAPHSVRLKRVEETAHCAIWQQHEWLAFEKDAQYDFRLWARSETPQQFQMRVVTRSGFTEVLADSFTVEPGDWKLLEKEFTAVCGAHGAMLEIRLMSEGPLWIGAISLMPADNFHGMRRDVIDLLKQLKPGNLRWPGGCFAEYYDWREGLMPVDKRPPIGPHRWVGLLPDSDGYDNHDIDTDAYIALCQELNAAPAITTRFSEGSSEEAAAWVEYCNGDAESTWGKIRAERGHPEAYNASYWYMGNEITGMSLLEGEARTNPELLAVACGKHVRAMKEADPDIAINVGVPSNAHWLDPLFDEVGGLLDEVQTGYYFPPDVVVTLDDSLHAPYYNVLPLLLQLRAELDQIAPAGEQIGISFYEWNVMWDRHGDARSGLFAAGMLNLMCREAESLGLIRASYFQPVTEGAIRVEPLHCSLEPDGQVFALYAAHQGNRLIRVPQEPDSVVDLCASQNEQDGSVFITLLNRNVRGDCKVHFSLGDFPQFEKAVAEMLIPERADGRSDFVQKQEVLEVSEDNRFVLEVPAAALAAVHLKAGQ